MNNLDQNWNNLFGEFTANETAWHGCWTIYSQHQEAIKIQRVIRSFRSNSENTVLLGLWLKLYLGIHFVLTIGAETLARRYISLAYHQIPRRALPISSKIA